ncbi:MAG: YdeI/OmpD-associated family protein [Armatimonadetes bacterium]|nr:YdeI/OmpD-associated family protein [Armatimonadota bacterium]
MGDKVAPMTIATGVVHDVPPDLRDVLTADVEALAVWEDLTPLARNEWICWIEDAKRPETRHKRMGRLRSDLRTGKRRPCCWPGCAHREKSGRAVGPVNGDT